jgi:hypothetical protein
MAKSATSEIAPPIVQTPDEPTSLNYLELEGKMLRAEMPDGFGVTCGYNERISWTACLSLHFRLASCHATLELGCLAAVIGSLDSVARPLQRYSYTYGTPERSCGSQRHVGNVCGLTSSRTAR